MKTQTAHRCPVCDGRGVVPCGFYNIFGGSTTDATPDVCRSCGGTGVIWRVECYGGFGDIDKYYEQ